MVDIPSILVTGYSIVLSMALTFRLTVFGEKMFFSHLGKAGISRLTGGGFDPDTITVLQLTIIEVFTSVVLGAIFFEQIFAFITEHFFWFAHFFIFGSAFALIYTLRLGSWSDSSDSAILKWRAFSIVLFIIALSMTDMANAHHNFYTELIAEQASNISSNMTQNVTN